MRLRGSFPYFLTFKNSISPSRPNLNATCIMMSPQSPKQNKWILSQKSIILSGPLLLIFLQVLCILIEYIYLSLSPRTGSVCFIFFSLPHHTPNLIEGCFAHSRCAVKYHSVFFYILKTFMFRISQLNLVQMIPLFFFFALQLGASQTYTFFSSSGLTMSLTFSQSV